MPEWALQLAGYALAAAAVYGGIRADLRNMGKRLDRVERIIDNKQWGLS